MTTWGPSKKTPSNRARSSGAPASRTSRTTAANRGGVRDATPPSTSRNRRTRAQDDLRGAVEGREHEFVGIGLIGGGVLLGLGMYWNLAGPVGRGIEKLFGWITGIGRFVRPAGADRGRDRARPQGPLVEPVPSRPRLGSDGVVGARVPPPGTWSRQDLGRVRRARHGRRLARRTRRRAAAGDARQWRRGRRAAGGVRRRAVARHQHIAADDGDADRSWRGIGGATTRAGRTQGDRRPVDAEQRQGRTRGRSRREQRGRRAVGARAAQPLRPGRRGRRPVGRTVGRRPSRASDAAVPDRRQERPANRNCRSKGCRSASGRCRRCRTSPAPPSRRSTAPRSSGAGRRCRRRSSNTASTRCWSA